MLSLVGANHLSTPVELRERLAIQDDALPEFLQRLLDQPGIDGTMVISTCNRTEILVSGSSADGVDQVRRVLADQAGISESEFRQYSYAFVEDEAIRHLLRVACGLDSMILGEAQIFGQFKRSYAAARQHGSLGPKLDQLIQHCIARAKKVRTESGISRNAVSVASAAVRLAQRIFGDLSGRSVLLLGAGKMSDLVATHLTAAGVGRVTVSSRRFTRAVASAERCGGSAVHWKDGIRELGRAEIVVCATASPRPVLTKADVAAAMKLRKRGRLFVIDIAVPRDVEPAVNELEHVYLYDIDALQDVVDANLEQRREAAKHAQNLIAQEVRASVHWRRAKDLGPSIVALRETLLRLGQDEIERNRSRLDSLNEQQMQAVEQVTQGVIRKILHPPIRRLQQSVQRGDVTECLSLYREIFHMPDVTTSSAKGDSATPEDRSDDGDEGLGPQRIVRGGKERT